MTAPLSRRDVLRAAAIGLVAASGPARAGLLQGPAPLPLGRPWFVRHHAERGLHLFTEPHVNRFGRCNIWYIEGRDRDLVFDTGTGLQPLRPVLPDRGGKPVIAIASHGHFDHVGSLHEFDARGLHESEAAAMATMPDDVTYADFFRRLPDPVSALPEAGWTVATYRPTPTVITLSLKDGDRIDLGDRVLTVLHVPGHSPCSIALFEATSETLFSGDALYDGGLIDDFANSNRADYARSMHRLRDLRIRIAHAGHGKSFDEIRKRALIDAYLAGLPADIAAGRP